MKFRSELTSYALVISLYIVKKLFWFVLNDIVVDVCHGSYDVYIYMRTEDIILSHISLLSMYQSRKS